METQAQLSQEKRFKSGGVSCAWNINPVSTGLCCFICSFTIGPCLYVYRLWL